MSKYVDRNYWYKRELVSDMKTEPKSAPSGLFYSVDYEALSSQSVVTGNVKNKQFYLTIETEDYIPDISVDDYVLYGGDDRMWIVDSLPMIEDKNESKEYSKRPPITTRIRLRRGV